MYSKLDLELIRIFGKKDLTEGCIVRKEKGKWFKIANIANIKYPYGKTYYKKAKGYGVHGKFYQPNFKTESDIEILGHIPELFPDVARVAEEKNIKIEIDTGFKYSIYLTVDDIQRDIAYNFSSTLLEQSEETKQALISLFS